MISNGRTETTWYDKYNFPVRTKDAEGKETIIEYFLDNTINRYGEVKLQVDRYGNATGYSYDFLGNVLTESQKRSNNTEAISRVYEYDLSGNQIRFTNENGAVATYGYDMLNRTTGSSITVPDINNVPVIHTTTITYDSNGNVMTEKDWRGTCLQK
jgi:uncharacterized protein RhaS with RHS repeats